MKHRTMKAGAATIAAFACLLAMALPASATVHNYNVKLVSGRITVGSINFDTPGSGIAACPGSTTISGTIDDAGGTDKVDGTLSINSPFVLPIFGGNYVLTASGTSGTGTNRGDYNAGTGTFSNLVIPTLSFTVKSINATTCVAGATVCSGTATLTSSGGLFAGATLPLTNPESLYVNSTGSITARGSCSFPFNAFISVGTALSVGDNPNDDWPGGGNPDPGAIFEQI